MENGFRINEEVGEQKHFCKFGLSEQTCAISEQCLVLHLYVRNLTVSIARQLADTVACNRIPPVGTLDNLNAGV